MINQSLLVSNDLVNVNFIKHIEEIITQDSHLLEEALANIPEMSAIEEPYNDYLKHNSWGIKKGQIVRHNNSNGKDFVKTKKKQLADIAHRITLLEKDGKADLEARDNSLKALEKSFEGSEREQSRRLAHKVQTLKDQVITVEPTLALELLKANDKATIKKIQKSISQSRVSAYKTLHEELINGRKERYSRFEEYIKRYETMALEYASEEEKYNRNHYNHVFGRRVVEQEYNTYLELNRLNIERGYVEYLKNCSETIKELKDQVLSDSMARCDDLIAEFKCDVETIIQVLKDSINTIEERYQIAYKNQNNKNLIKIHSEYLNTTGIEECLSYGIKNHYDIYNGRNYNIVEAFNVLKNNVEEFRSSWLQKLEQYESLKASQIMMIESAINQEYLASINYYNDNIERIDEYKNKATAYNEKAIAAMKEEQKVQLERFEADLKSHCENIKEDDKKRLDREKERLNQDLAADNEFINQKIKASLKK